MVDSQSVKADALVSADSRSFDGGKQINGRKRHVVVDALGLLLGVMVTSANVGDRAAAQVLLRQVTDAHHQLELVWADGGYTGPLGEYCPATFALVLAIVKRSDDMRGFVVLPKRWIVERLFAHLMRTRRLARDQAFRLGPQCLHPRRNHVHAEQSGHLLAGQRPLPEPGPVRELGEDALIVHRLPVGGRCRPIGMVVAMPGLIRRGKHLAHP